MDFIFTNCLVEFYFIFQLLLVLDTCNAALLNFSFDTSCISAQFLLKRWFNLIVKSSFVQGRGDIQVVCVFVHALRLLASYECIRNACMRFFWHLSVKRGGNPKGSSDINSLSIELKLPIRVYVLHPCLLIRIKSGSWIIYKYELKEEIVGYNLA